MIKLSEDILYNSELYEFIFFTLQLLDEATLYSKKEVLKEYENNKDKENLEELLLNKSIYPNGEKLGFYNISKYTLNDILNKEEFKLEEFFSDKKIFLEKLELFLEYFNGFNKEIQELFDLIPDLGPDLITSFATGKHITINESIAGDTGKFVYALRIDKHKEIISTVISDKRKVIELILVNIKNLLKLEEKYVNYEGMSELLINVLFEDIEFEDNVSILHIKPDNPLIFSCFDYIKDKNPECSVDLYVLSPDIFLTFSLRLLSILYGNMNFNNIHYDNKDENNIYKAYSFVSEQVKRFDFVIQPNLLESGFDLVDTGDFITDYGVEVSSRIIYISEFGFVGLKEDWLEKDLLESLILIPCKSTISSKTKSFKLALLTVLDYQKSDKRKNKFLVVDKNHNYDTASMNYALEDYKNLIKSNEIYSNSYKAFSEFNNDSFSKLIFIDSYKDKIADKITHADFDFMFDSELPTENDRLNDWKRKIELFEFDFNEEMYDVKMKSQLKYYEKVIFEGETRKTEKLDYPQEKLLNLIRLNSEIEDADNDLVAYSENSLYFFNEFERNDKFVFLESDIGNTSNYYDFNLISEKVSLQYLYYFLNSEIGKNEYYYFFRGHEGFKPYVYNIRVPIPPKEIQTKIVDVMNKRDDFLKEMRLLEKTTNENFFDYDRNMSAVSELYGKREYDEETQELSIPNNLQYVHSGLIWPLAITYLIATSGGFEKVEKANNLLRLFEFTVAFNSYVLISGIPDEIYEINKTRIWDLAYDKRDNEEKFNRKFKLSFGSWAHFHGVLKGIYKNDFSTEINKEFYLKLLDKKIRNKYIKLANERNDQFHGGISNAYEAESLINELNTPQEEIFNHLNSCYEKFRLYYTTGRVDIKTNEHEIIFLNGPYSMPIYSTITNDEILEPESLYLHDLVEDKFTKLNDNLIKFKAIDEMKHDWRLYIFIGFETDRNGNKKAKYRCYQRKEEDLLEDINLNELM